MERHQKAAIVKACLGVVSVEDATACESHCDDCGRPHTHYARDKSARAGANTKFINVCSDCGYTTLATLDKHGQRTLEPLSDELFADLLERARPADLFTAESLGLTLHNHIRKNSKNLPPPPLTGAP